MDKNLTKIRHTKDIVSSILQKIFTVSLLLFIFVPTTSAADVTCEQLKQPEVTQNYVMTILEEQFGAPTDDGKSLHCFRVTKCYEKEVPKPGQTAKDGTTKKPVCESTYESTCPLNQNATNTAATDTSSTDGVPADAQISCQKVMVILTQSGIDLLFTYIGLLYKWLASVIGIVSVFFIIFGSVKIATAGDDSSAVDEAKTKLIQSLVGLVLLFMSAVILYTINPNFFVL